MHTAKMHDNGAHWVPHQLGCVTHQTKVLPPGLVAIGRSTCIGGG